MQKVNAHVSGMHCASCIHRIEKTVGGQPGVQDIAVNLATNEARVTFDESKTDLVTLSKTIEPFGYQLHPKSQTPGNHMDHDMVGVSGHDHARVTAGETEALRKKALISMPMVVIAAAMMFWDILAKFNAVPAMSETIYEFFHHLLPIFATYMFFTVGTPYLRGLWIFIRRGVADMDTLVGLGTMAAFLYSFALTAFEGPLALYVDVKVNYYDVTIVVIGLITLGKYFEARAKARTGSAIKQLLGLQAKTATVLRDGKEMTIGIDRVQEGDIVLVKPGMKIPVDGIIVEGSSFLNESMLTGESVLVEKTVGDKVSAGTLNTTGAFSMHATGVGSETLLAHIIALVEEAQGSKAPIQRLADKISSIFVPIVLVVAVVSLIAWLVIGGQHLSFAQSLSYGLVSFVSVLVIACPCALGLATPTAIMVGVGRGALQGILIKNAEVLEKLHQVTTLVIDKTGTLTEGKLEVMNVAATDERPQNEALAILASLEVQSEHPIAEAIVRYAEKEGVAKTKVSDFENIPGQGLKAVIDGVIYYAGGPNLLKTLGLNAPKAIPNQVTTVVYLMTEKEVLLSVAIGDRIKEGAKEALRKLSSLGVKVIMATGDNKEVADAVAKELGIKDFLAQVLPQEKLAKVQELQKKGEVVAMAGDGVNDAPALTQADVGIAMATGSDVSIETSDVALLHGDIRKIAQAIELSKATMSTVRENLFWAFIYNIIGIPLATGIFFPVFGWLLSPVFAGFAMAMSSVSVVLNSLRLKAKKL